MSGPESHPESTDVSRCGRRLKFVARKGARRFLGTHALSLSLSLPPCIPLRLGQSQSTRLQRDARRRVSLDERSLESALESDFASISSAQHGRRRIARSSPITIGSALSDAAGALPYRVSYRSANRRFLPATTPGIRRRRVHSEIRRHAPPRKIALGRNRVRRRAISSAWMKAGQGAGSNIDAQDIVHASHARRDLPKTRTRSNIFAGPARTQRFLSPSRSSWKRGNTNAMRRRRL